MFSGSAIFIHSEFLQFLKDDLLISTLRFLGDTTLRICWWFLSTPFSRRRHSFCWTHFSGTTLEFLGPSASSKYQRVSTEHRRSLGAEFLESHAVGAVGVREKPNHGRLYNLLTVAASFFLPHKLVKKTHFLVKLAHLHLATWFVGSSYSYRRNKDVRTIWANYNDVSRGHPKWWFNKGTSPKSH